MASYNLLFHVQSMKQRLLLLKLISCSSTLLLDILPILGMAAMQTLMMSKAGDGDATQGAKHFQKRKRQFSLLGYCCKKLCLLRFSISKTVSIKNVNLAEAGSLAIDESFCLSGRTLLTYLCPAQVASEEGSRELYLSQVSKTGHQFFSIFHQQLTYLNGIGVFSMYYANKGNQGFSSKEMEKTIQWEH